MQFLYWNKNITKIMTKKKSKRKFSFNINSKGKLQGKLEWNHKRLSTIKRMIAASKTIEL